MPKFELVSLTDQHPFIKLIKETLERSTKQLVAYIAVEKMKKTAGVSTKDVMFNMENGQSLQLSFRIDGDVVKVLLNNKNLPLRNVMDYDNQTAFLAGVEDLALLIKSNQPKFDKQRQNTKVLIPRNTDRAPSKKQQLEEINRLNSEIDQQIDEAEKQLISKQQESAALGISA